MPAADLPDMADQQQPRQTAAPDRDPWTGPPKDGLYDPQLEKEACGVGFIVAIDGKRSNKVTTDRLRPGTNYPIIINLGFPSIASLDCVLVVITRTQKRILYCTRTGFTTHTYNERNSICTAFH